MTTKNFSATKLPQPSYQFELGLLNLGLRDPHLSSWIPRSSHIAQVIEVRRTGCTTQKIHGCKIDDITCSLVVIEDARLELFLRRDFISRFVERGTIHLMQDTKSSKLFQLKIHTSNNVLHMTMSGKLYRRFGLVGKKIRESKVEEMYRVEVDLTDERIKKSNKFQDKLVEVFKRLEPINKLYFRFVPDRSCKIANAAANEESLDFFRYVIDEYARDGFRPVPLTACSIVEQRLHRSWLNCSQRHPALGMNWIKEDCSLGEVRGNVEILGRIVDIVDWLGYQLLSLDCDREEISSSYSDEMERLDVSCIQLNGPMDQGQIENNLRKIFAKMKADFVVARALILYNQQDPPPASSSPSGVVFLQDCESCSSERMLLTAIGMSSKST